MSEVSRRRAMRGKSKEQRPGFFVIKELPMENIAEEIDSLQSASALPSAASNSFRYD